MYGNANAQGAVQRRAEDGRGSIALFPIMAAVFVAFLVIGMAMPVLPLHVHEGLALSTFIVGLVAGTQFGAAILSRVWAGRYADASGAKRAVIVGLLIPGYERARLSRFAVLRCQAFALGGDSTARPRAGRRGRKL